MIFLYLFLFAWAEGSIFYSWFALCAKITIKWKEAQVSYFIKKRLVHFKKKIFVLNNFLRQK